jgi:hypothetical protein
LRRNGSGPDDGRFDGVDCEGGTLEIEGGATDEGCPPPTAGRPIIVFFRGGLDEYALTGGLESGSGGGVTTGGGVNESPPGGTNP